MSKLLLRKHIVCFSLLSLVVSNQGCDKISKLPDYFSGKMKSKKMETVSSQQKTAAIPPSLEAEPTSEKESPKSVKSESQPLDKDVLAQVGNWTLTVDEFKGILSEIKQEAGDAYKEGDKNQKMLIIEELVRQQLLVQDAEAKGIANKKEIVDDVEKYKRAKLVEAMVTELTQGVEVSEEEIKTYYEENPQDFAEPAKWRVREIVVPTEEEAKEILIELYKGADFEEMVKNRSKGKSAWKKGDLSYQETFDFPTMDSVVSALEVGKISGVFKGPEGFYIVKLEDKQGGEKKSLESMQENIKNWLIFVKQREKLLNYLQELREKTSIQVNENLLED